ncbi:hypothetical protein TNCV_4107701 [Trichonephila clavipes]|nr:hypothetical protein TNCV_4107701 [Trichonephila clavipes]
MSSSDVSCKGSLFLGLQSGICSSIFGGMSVWDVIGGDVAVVVSKTELVLVSKGGKIYIVDEESALLDDATEIQRLLGVEEEVSFKGIGEDSDVVTAVDVMDVKCGSKVSPEHHFPPYGASVGHRERKGIPRTPFSSYRDAAYGKHVGWETNGVS